MGMAIVIAAAPTLLKKAVPKRNMKSAKPTGAVLIFWLSKSIEAKANSDQEPTKW